MDPEIKPWNTDTQSQGTIPPNQQAARLIVEDMKDQAQIKAADTKLQADLRNPWSSNPHETPLPVWDSSDRSFQLSNILLDLLFVGFVRRKGKARLTYALTWLTVVGLLVSAYYFFVK